MSIKKSPIEKVSEKVSLLSARDADALTAFNLKRRELKRVHSRLDAQEAITASIKAEAVRVRKELRRMRWDAQKSGRELLVAKLKLSVLVQSNKQKEDKKMNAPIVKKLNKGQFSDPLLDKISRLPEDVVYFISTFLPDDVVYDVRVRELENRKPTKSLLNRCDDGLKNRILLHFSRKPEFLSTIPYQEAVEQVRVIGGEVNNSWSPYYWTWNNSMQNVKILHLIDMAKASNPKFAYEILRWFHVLIDPKKKYSYEYNVFQHRELTEEDLYLYHPFPML